MFQLFEVPVRGEVLNHRKITDLPHDDLFRVEHSKDRKLSAVRAQFELAGAVGMNSDLSSLVVHYPRHDLSGTARTDCRSIEPPRHHPN